MSDYVPKIITYCHKCKIDITNDMSYVKMDDRFLFWTRRYNLCLPCYMKGDKKKK